MSRMFEELKAGDTLVVLPSRDLCASVSGKYLAEAWVVTDRWFDPVRGQDSRSSGEMVAVRKESGGRKQAHTVRGLAQAGFRYPDSDEGRVAAMWATATK